MFVRGSVRCDIWNFLMCVCFAFGKCYATCCSWCLYYDGYCCLSPFAILGLASLIMSILHPNITLNNDSQTHLNQKYVFIFMCLVRWIQLYFLLGYRVWLKILQADEKWHGKNINLNQDKQYKFGKNEPPHFQLVFKHKQVLIHHSVDGHFTENWKPKFTQNNKGILFFCVYIYANKQIR